MIEIVNITYTFKKVDDIYTLKNVSNDDTITYFLYKEKCDGIEELVLEGELIINAIKNFTDLKDGKYHIIVVNLNTDEYTNIYFNTYPFLRKQSISLIENLLCCDCGCNSLEDTLFVSKDCKTAVNFQTEYGYILSYFYSLKPLNETSQATTNTLLVIFLEALFNKYSCNINEELCKQYFNNCLEGLNINNDINKIQLTLIYLSLYLYEKSLINSNESIELTYLKSKYNYDKVIKCIKKLGINIEEIEELFTEITNTYEEGINCPTIEPNNIIHLTQLQIWSDLNSIWIFNRLALLLNYEAIAGVPTHIMFYNLTGKDTILSVNGVTLVDNTPYLLSSLNNSIAYPNIISENPLSYPNFIALLTSNTGTNEILEYGIKTDLSPTYNTSGRININIL